MNSNRIPLISIIVPIYNVEKYLDKCIRSLINQEYPNKEIILIDDGSTDKSGALCDKLKKQNGIIKVVHQENRGVAGAKNRGLTIAQGKYIAFCDPDDFVDKDMYISMINKMEETHTDMCICGIQHELYVNEYLSQTQVVTKMEFRDVTINDKKTFELLYLDLWKSEIMYSSCNKIYKKAIIESGNIYFPDGQIYNEDRVFNRLYLEKTSCLCVINNCYYHYIRERIGAHSKVYIPDLFEIRLLESNRLAEHFFKMGIRDNNTQEYIYKELIDRVLGCIENIFHEDARDNMKQKQIKLKSIVDNMKVQEAVKHIKKCSLKVRILILPIKFRMLPMVFGEGWLLHLIRMKMPYVFNVEKARR